MITDTAVEYAQVESVRVEEFSTRGRYGETVFTSPVHGSDSGARSEVGAIPCGLAYSLHAKSDSL